MKEEKHLRSADEMEQFARQFAGTIAPPAVLMLDGHLGAGKTTFTRGFVSAFGQARVKSPTYALAHSYATTPVVHHLDLYRLSESHEALELGLGELLADSEAFTIVEWAAAVPALFVDLPGELYSLRFAQGEDEDHRIVTIEKRNA